jgi:large subunit ribosomal protein L6
MSRIGKRPVAIPAGVSVETREGVVHVKGKKGALSLPLPPGIGAEVADGEVRLVRPDDARPTRALHGLARALVANMVTGVTEGFRRELEIEGVGFRADVQGRKLNLQLGFSHPIAMEVPEGLSVSVEANTRIRIEGIDKARVGQFAADVRAMRPPEPYKGKGVRYAGERIRRKVGKAGVA